MRPQRKRLGLFFGVLLLLRSEPAPASPELIRDGLLTPSDRLRWTRLLVPQDAHMSIHRKLPEVEMLTVTQLADNYRDIQTPRYLGIYTWMDLGVNFIIRSEYEKALDCYRRLDARSLNKFDTKMVYAWLHERLNRYADALRMYDEIIKSDGGSLDVYYRKACCELTLLRVRAAKETIDNMLAITTQRPDVLHLKGLYDFLQGDFEQSRKTFVGIITQDDPDVLPETYLAMAIIHLHLKMQHDAVGWLHMALQSMAPAEQVYVLNQPDWRHIQNTEAFVNLIAQNRYPYFREGLPDDIPEIKQTAGAKFYAEQFALPESLRVSIHLREHDPYTRFRTLKGRLNVENYE